ncbi:MAG: UDP-glucose 4-epimerase, partial [Acidobacteriaceae bacterium]|nr:UDP-glucose 4-epimerase [Acidobacteriaceae bacterium]
TSSIEYVPYDKAYEPGFEDMMRRVPSVEKLFALTGFRPQTPLNEIIDRVTHSFQAKSGRVPEVPVPQEQTVRLGDQHLS